MEEEEEEASGQRYHQGSPSIHLKRQRDCCCSPSWRSRRGSPTTAAVLPVSPAPEHSKSRTLGRRSSSCGAILPSHHQRPVLTDCWSRDSRGPLQWQTVTQPSPPEPLATPSRSTSLLYFTEFQANDLLPPPFPSAPPPSLFLQIWFEPVMVDRSKSRVKTWRQDTPSKPSGHLAIVQGRGAPCKGPCVGRY